MLAFLVNESMASINVRNIDEATVAAMRVRAGRAGVSMEDGVRRIPEESVKGEDSAGGRMVRIFSPSCDGDKLEPAPHEANCEPKKFCGEK
jgi:plasmid stability protein